MSRIFDLTADIRGLIRDTAADFIEQTGTVCRLFYAPAWQDCTECAGGVPPNRWVTGGRVEVRDASLCLQCGGTGKHAVEQHEDVTLLVSRDSRRFFIKPAPGVLVPDGAIQTKCFAASAAKLTKCLYMLVDPDNAAGFRWKYERDGDVKDIGKIVRGEFVVTQWKRVV